MNYLGMVGIWQIGIILLALSSIVLAIMAIMDILKSEFKGNNKIVWVVVVLFSHLVGAILYFTIGIKQKVKS